MSQYGFYVNAQLCTGCRTCQVACKDVNRLGVGENFRNVESYCTGTFPDVFMYHVSVSCNHCTSPACTESCPTGAMYKDAETGLVLHNDAVCIGCKTCTEVCPYGAPAFIEHLGIVKKCDGCAGLRLQGEKPACVAACPMRVLEFGEIDALVAAHAAEGTTSDFAVMPSSATTGPNAIFSVKPCMLDKDYDYLLM